MGGKNIFLAFLPNEGERGKFLFRDACVFMWFKMADAVKHEINVDSKAAAEWSINF